MNKLIAQEGTRLSNFIVSTGLCCPARASLFTGRFAHCHNITANHNNAKGGLVMGGFRKFYESGLDAEWLPSLLRAADYDTYLVGKFLNGYTEDTRIIPARDRRRGYVPRGIKHMELLSTHVYSMYNSCYSINGLPRTCPIGQYQTDAIRDRAVDLINSTLMPRQPFFLYVGPTAPHREESKQPTEPIAPPERYKTLYNGEGIKAPRGPNFGVPNPDMRKGAWMVDDRTYIDYMDNNYIVRLRAIRAIDDLVESVVEALRAKNLLDETYIIYTSDNGYHLGAFRLRSGKNSPIEEDVRVPFYIRGPGIPAGAVLPYQGNIIDITPTLLTLAGLPVPDIVDGLPLPLTPELRERYDTLIRAANPQPQAQPLPADSTQWLRRDNTILEAWNGELGEDDKDLSVHFKGLRLCTETRLLPPLISEDLASQPDWAARFVRAPGTYCYKYLKWCGPGALRELYDLASDPYETQNRLSEVPQRLLDRLDGVLSALVHCSGAACRSPYALLHPEGGVLNFSMTLDPAYDNLYRSLPKLRILDCMGIYRISNELTWTMYQPAAGGFVPWAPNAFLPDVPMRPPPAPRRGWRPSNQVFPPDPPEAPAAPPDESDGGGER
ncbi:hypothetical protein HYH03_002023 [Edaphochlamys debaryana]|uniref:Sulfatase N-terminal domain-containing protein n=1 Tax=Edaphochlamys debaryana TaxID=47281 RepID=A0A836C4R6_9CHLO|nr:hypothetical protein HYH03_002023 [Edaphochlamys debaryana]|eukprot:KAG2500456.1 hypothetical protein HYH03_002023 [Edaphochlamys debaryana]